MLPAAGQLRHLPLPQVRHVALPLVVVAYHDDLPVVFQECGVELPTGHFFDLAAAEVGQSALAVIVATEDCQ